MFTLEKHSDVSTASSVKVGGVFLHEGEFYVRVVIPKQFGDDITVLGMSLETWRMKSVPPTTEVQIGRVKAVAYLGDGVDD